MKNKSKVISELQLVKKAHKRLLRSAEIDVCLDVPIMGRCVDLAYLCKGEITTIEFKLKDWKRALKQARDHMLGADYCYICMPERSITDYFKTEIESSGIGLLFFRNEEGWPFQIIVEAPRSRQVWEVVHNKTKEYIQMKKGA